MFHGKNYDVVAYYKPLTETANVASPAPPETTVPSTTTTPQTTTTITTPTNQRECIAGCGNDQFCIIDCTTQFSN